jgi:uncharacterized protein with HEPN domain
VKSERAYLEHILYCAGRIADDAAGGKQAVFASPTLQDAIIRNLPVLCESAQRISEGTKSRYPQVDWRAISGLRNVLVHDYFSVDLETIWTILAADLPTLERTVCEILATLPEEKT